MTTPLTHTFSAAVLTDTATGQPFGDKFGGIFEVRRPSAQDKIMIAAREQAVLNAYGPVYQNQLPQGMLDVNYAFAFFGVLAKQKPEWFDSSKIYEEVEERAVLVVYEEVSRWLKETFPAGGGRGAGVEGSGQPPVLVSPALPTPEE